MLETIGWYLSIFFGLFFSGIGIPPVPEEIGIASAAAVTRAHDELRWWLALPAVCLGILCADTVVYWIGRRWGHQLFRYRWVERIIKAKRRERIEKKFHNHGLKILMTARLLPPLRTGVFMIAGAVKYPFPMFLLADAMYAVVGVPLFFFASQWIVSLLLGAGHHWALYVIAGVLALLVLYHYYGHLRKREEQGTAEPPESVLEMPPAPPPCEAAVPAADRQETARPS